MRSIIDEYGSLLAYMLSALIVIKAIPLILNAANETIASLVTSLIGG